MDPEANQDVITIPADGSLTPEVKKALGIDEKFTNIKDLPASQRAAEVEMNRKSAENDLLTKTVDDLKEAAEAQDELLLSQGGGGGGDGAGGGGTPPVGDPRAAFREKFEREGADAMYDAVIKGGEFASQQVKDLKAELKKDRDEEKEADAEKRAEASVATQAKALQAELGEEEFTKHLSEIQRRLSDEVTSQTLRKNTVKRLYRDILDDMEEGKQTEQQQKYLAAAARKAAEMGTGVSQVDPGAGGKPLDDLSEEQLLTIMKKEGVVGIK